MSTKRWIIVSNRLPLNKDPSSGELGPSSGGLVAAITGIEAKTESIWIGAVPPGITEEEWEKNRRKHKGFKQYVPIFIPKRTYDKYYNGISNKVFWPLFHYESQLVRFDWDDWSAYKRVNELFAERIAKVARPNDLIWIHDFHLFLVPQYLKRKKPNLKVGFFLHIPFPSSEVYRQLPVRREILEGLLTADLIGFHDYSYLRHFCTSLQLVLGIESSLLMVPTEKKTVQLGVFPVSINSERIKKVAKSAEVKRLIKSYRKKQHYDYAVLGVDRLDYSKGIELKLEAFREMLLRHPELQGKASLIQIAVPTRTHVPEYARLKWNVEKLVGEINGQFGKPNYVPVQYMYGSVPLPSLVAMYRMSRALLVTSKRDGMNLVALEYIAAQNPKRPGTVILSEFTGAVSTLSHVVPVNPWDVVETADTLAKTLKMEKKAQVQKHAMMLSYLKKYSATHWATSFLDSLDKVKLYRRKINQRIEIETKGSSLKIPEDLIQKVQKKKPLIMMDYDGTLVPIHDIPEKATLPSKVKSALGTILRNKDVEMVVVSGRKRKFLVEQFESLKVSMAAEHGAFFYDKMRNRWESLVHTDKQSWYPIAKKIMEDYTYRVPESLLETKEYSLSWHYRKSPPEFAEYQAKKLHEELELGLANRPVTIIRGKKIIEARAVEANKGTFARWYVDDVLSTSNGRVVIAIGDDRTDEDMFSSVPEGSVTVKIGEGDTFAHYRLASQEFLIKFLQSVTRAASR